MTRDQHMTLADLQDAFDAAANDAEREEIRQELRDAGYNGVADTIGRNQ